MGLYQNIDKIIDENLEIEHIVKVFNFILNHSNLFIEGVGLISGGFILNKAVKSFNDAVFPQSDFDKLKINSLE